MPRQTIEAVEVPRQQRSVQLFLGQPATGSLRPQAQTWEGCSVMDLSSTVERTRGAPQNTRCTVFEYRDVEEPGNHIDMWQYRLPGGEQVWFEVRVGPTVDHGKGQTVPERSGSG